MGKRLDGRVVCLLLVACLELATAPAADAQQPGGGSDWTQRALAGCSLRRLSGCINLAVNIWDTVADRFLGSVNPTDAASRDPIVRTGVHYQPNAPDLYALDLLVESELGSSGTCGRLSDRRKLAVMMCNANNQLSPYRRNGWREEKKALADLRSKLVGAGCLPSAPEDPCELVTPEVVAALQSEKPVELEAQGPLELETDLE